MDDSKMLASSLASSFEAAVCILSFMTFTFFVSQIVGYYSLRDFPLVGNQFGSYPKRLIAYIHHAEALYRDGYAKFRNTPFRITTVDGQRLVVPVKYLDELRQRADDEINNTKPIFMITERKYTGVPADLQGLGNLVRTRLTPNLSHIIGRLSEEIDQSIALELSLCEDWTPVAINKKLLHIVAIASGNIFVGPELCHNQEYLHASIKYTVDVFAAVAALKKWPQFLRPVGRFFIPELRTIIEHKETAKRLLTPAIQKRRAMMLREDELPQDMLQWMLDMGGNSMQDDTVAMAQLELTLAAVHTTSVTCTHILYDLAANPEVIQQLRREISSVLEGAAGGLTTNSLFQMKLLDSVMKESHRMNPSVMASFARYVEKAVKLHDGVTIPAGTMIETPRIAISRDPTFYPDPDTFNPYRFYELRKGVKGSQTEYASTEQCQFVSVSKEHLGFGYGRHACPGRFFAAHEIKLIIARLLLDYDIKMPDGQSTRFENIQIASKIIPDPTKVLLLRKVQA